jgi:hypothetical protein
VSSISKVKQGLFEVYASSLEEDSNLFKLHIKGSLDSVIPNLQEGLRLELIDSFKILANSCAEDMGKYLSWFDEVKPVIQKGIFSGYDYNEKFLENIKQIYVEIGDVNYFEGLISSDSDSGSDSDGDGGININETKFLARSVCKELLPKIKSPEVKEHILTSLMYNFSEGFAVYHEDYKRYLTNAPGTIYLNTNTIVNNDFRSFLVDLDKNLSGVGNVNHIDFDNSFLEYKIEGLSNIYLRLSKDDEGRYVFHNGQYDGGERADESSFSRSRVEVDEFLKGFKGLEGYNDKKRKPVLDGGPFLGKHLTSEERGVREGAVCSVIDK